MLACEHLGLANCIYVPVSDNDEMVIVSAVEKQPKV